MAVTAVKERAKVKTEPKIYLNLKFFILLGISLILLLGPFMSGLFFEPEWLFIQIIVASIFVLHWLDKALKGEDKLTITYFDIINIALVAMFFLSIFVAVNMKGAYTTAFRHLTYYLVFFLVSRNVTSIKNRHLILNIVFIAGTGVALVGLLSAAQIFNIPGAFEGKRINSVFQYPNTFATYCSAAFFIGLALWTKAKNIISKIYFAGGLYFLTVAIIGSQSRGTWLVSLFVGLIYLVLLFIANQDFWRNIYNLMLIMTGTVVGAKGFLTNVFSKNYGTSLKWLLLGLVVIVAGQVIFQLIEKLLEKIEIENRYKNLIIIGSLAYILVIGFFYLNYMGDALPSLSDHLAATEITKRVQSLESGDRSLNKRTPMFIDALEIIKDYPLLGIGGTGWNYLYHQYQDYLYWSSEVHNHFLQVGVETGIVGLLLYLAVFIYLIYLIVKKWKQELQVESIISYIGLITAITVLVVHSGVDFDFTYGIMPLLTFVLIGLTLAQGVNGKYAIKALDIKWKKALILALVSSIIFLTPSFLEYRSGILGARAAQAMEKQQFDDAILNFERASMISPFSHTFTADLAQLYAAKHVYTNKAIYKDKAQEYLTKTLELSPNDLKISQALSKAHSLLGDQLGVLQEQERLVNLLPKDSKANLSLATTYFNLGLTNLKADQKADSAKHFAKTEELINYFFDKKNKEKVPKEYKRKMDPLPGHYLLKGQLAFLKGNSEDALLSLNEAAKAKDTKDIALAWMAATYIVQEQSLEVEKVKKQIKNQQYLYQIPEITSLYRQIN